MIGGSLLKGSVIQSIYLQLNALIPLLPYKNVTYYLRPHLIVYITNSNYTIKATINSGPRGEGVNTRKGILKVHYISIESVQLINA